MKKRDLIKLLEKNGWEFSRCGGNHDVYIKGKETEVIDTLKSMRTLRKQ